MWRKISELFLKSEKKKWIYLVIGIMSVAVVFTTVHMLTLPAVTLEKDNSYEATAHEHKAECYDEEGNLICTYTDDNKKEPPSENGEHINNDASYSQELVPDQNEIQEEQHANHEEPLEDAVAVPNLEENQTTENIQSVPDNNVNSKQESTLELKTVNQPIKLEDAYIESFELSYEDKDKKWIKITSETRDIPGDATVMLQIKYHEVDIERLKKAGCEIEYTLPELLKEPDASGNLLSGNEVIGKITSNKIGVILTFNEEWIAKQQKEGNTQLSGSFYVKSQFDGTKVEEGKPGSITIGGIAIKVNFEEDVAAKRGKVIIEKGKPSFKEEGGKDYLEYTLKVSVPDGEADVPEVKVVDQFTQNSAYVKEYVGVTGSQTSTAGAEGIVEIYQLGKTPGSVYIGNSNMTSENSIPKPAGDSFTKPGILVWDIEKMTGGETRSLTYRVELKENYKASNTKDSINIITNSASVYSKIYNRGEAVQNYNPNIHVTLKKTAGEFVPNKENSGGTIEYKIWVQASKDNGYTVENVKIVDYIKTTEAVPYLDYDEKSFHLYESNVTSGKEISLETVRPEDKKQNPVIQIKNDATNTENDPKKKFDLYIGSLKPGEEKTVTYKVNVKEDIWFSANHDIQLDNRARVFSDDSVTDGNKQYEAWTCYSKISGKKWSRKIAGSFTDSGKIIEIPNIDDVYNKSFDKVKNVTKFMVPAYSQEYKLVVNEEGRFDFSNVLIQDTLQQDYVKHAGYLKLEAYNINSAVTRSTTDQEAIDKIKKQGKLDKTVWLDIDNSKEFSFQPFQLGLQRSQAYIITYYSAITNSGAQHSIPIKNSFNISEKVIGPDGTEIQIPGIQVDNEVIIQGENHYQSEKIGWYYERPNENSRPNWNKGELYWAVKVTGNHIPKGMKIKDQITDTNSHMLIKDESLVGVYKGVLPNGNSIKDVKNIAELESMPEMKKLQGEYAQGSTNSSSVYHWEVKDNNGQQANLLGKYLVLQFDQDITLNETKGEAVYVVIKTSPKQLPQDKRTSKEYTNSLYTNQPGSEQWSKEADAKLTVFGSYKIFKETQGAYTFDGTNWKTLVKDKHNSADKLAKELIRNPGIYIEWLAHINWDGTMKGLAEIEDQLPEGVELTYVRYYWLSPFYRENGRTAPTTPVINELEGSPSWEKKNTVANLDNTSDQQNQKECTYYYNKNERKVRWNVKGLEKGGTKNDERAVEFQIVCRVTDKDALMGGKDVSINNILTVTNAGEKYTDSDDIRLHEDTLYKTSEYHAETDGGSYPFQIEINPLGEDMVPDADTVMVVDQLSPTLTLEPQTIKVMNGETDITEYCQVKMDDTPEGQVMYLTVPDSKHLIITYETFVNAKPGQEVVISNKAHWEGYEETDEGVVVNPEFSYSAGGTAGGNQTPSLKVVKRDAGNALTTLSGAGFSVQKVQISNDGQISLTGTKYKGTTDEKGEVVFPNGSDKWMKFNEIYCLKEENAPLGYVRDDKPYYFAIAKEETESTGKVFPEYVHVWYQSPQYEYKAYNRKGDIKVVKNFQKADGTTLEKPLNGDYKFGIYSNEQAAGDPIHTLTMSYMNDTWKYQVDGRESLGPVFTGLEIGKEKSYYVYELNDDGKPIKNGEMATVDGKTFDVTYQETEGISLDQNNGDGTVKITNKVRQFKLPETGGKGTMFYMASGIILLLISIFVFILKKKEDK